MSLFSPQVSIIRKAIMIVLALLSCGRVGESLKSNSLGDFATVEGVVTAHGGGQEEMGGWVVVLIDADSGISRSAQIDENGHFSLSHVYTNLTYTIALLSPNLTLRAVLAHPVDNGVQQYFYLNGQKSLPVLVHNGPTLYWQDTSDISLEGPTVRDSDGDGVPEGVVESLTSSDLSVHLTHQKLHQPLGLLASAGASSWDIDGDGLVNILDHNVDGDASSEEVALLNEFDTDSNGDSSNDLLQKKTGAYFTRGAEWVIVQYEVIPRIGSSTSYDRTIFFGVKLYNNVKSDVKSISIKRQPSLPFLEESLVVTVDANGATTEVEWDGTLLDDGNNQDGVSSDGFFGRKVSLKNGATPPANQVIVFEVRYQTWTQEFIYVFPPIQPAKPQPSYSSLDRGVTFNGELYPPFGEHLNFRWIVKVFEVDDEDNLTSVYTSQAILGSEEFFVLPDNIMEIDRDYKYRVIAQTQEKVPAYSVFNVSSSLKDL